MPGPLRNAVLGAVAATVIAGCGGSDDGTIPQDKGQELLSRLDAIESNVEQASCEEAQDQADAFKSDVNLLPASVEGEVKAGLQDAADHLVNLTSDQCQVVHTGATGPTGPTSDETETDPTTDPTTTEDTTTEETTSEEEPTEEEEEPTEDEPVEPQTDEPQEDEDLSPPSEQGQGVGSDGGVSPSSGGVGSGGDG